MSSIAKNTGLTAFLLITTKKVANARIISEIKSSLSANHCDTPDYHVTAKMFLFSSLLFSSMNCFCLPKARMVEAPEQLSLMKLSRGLFVKLSILVVSLNDEI